MARRIHKNTELKSSQTPIMLHKYDMSTLRNQSDTHWKIGNLQPFFPSIEKLFKTENLENTHLYGFRFAEEIMSIIGPSTIRSTSGKEVEIHRKTTMLLSPFKWMKGTYGSALGMPTTSETANAVNSKLQNTNNAGYVGALISAVLSNSGCLHFPKVYGVFTGTAGEHTIDISDDYGEISERPWFSQNIGKLFDIKLSDLVQNHVEFRHTRCARTSLQLGDDILLDGISELEAPVVGDVTIGEMNRILHDEDLDGDQSSDTSSVSTEDMFEIMSCACDEEDEDEEILDEEESCEPFAWATFKNVPVQMTIMEKCNGTLYELFMMNLDPEKHLAWMTQVMFALAYAQRNFGFTHNDLHANNVMYVPYDKEFLYYNCGSQLYKVPTFGYLIKIIDFERGIASVKISGMKEPKVFMSDHYGLDEEAGGMFNYDVYYTPKYPEIKPNASGDLVRLATSLYWDLFPEVDPNSRLCGMMRRWMSTETGSIMFGKKDPHHDRYHGFELYKAIVRFCKDSAVPRKEIGLLKDLYGVESGGENVLLIE
jgi:hypothetical protein